ncbi:CHAP domain-containing protein [Nonomuraea sp. FMUSA5-5]|uniref:CHAP domain-containing protein n=1 Tax=Nonomuraea composti TaxID=2720023 RepID=A0ABX1B9E7_9ACTN|nr:CHAP domain-containing protein [Nonomuraea sp. FMUSA5-5]NJP94419.1 CHAP domain-containing protein [Nonomuraea sp. FMUSA5-5]
MTPEIQKYIELLESQLGYAEKSGSYTKFGDWYGKNVEFDADYSSAPWCDMYLSWAAHKLGYEDWIGQFAWTVAHAKWFKEQGAWGKTPKPGAFVFYDWSGSNDIDNIDHVGIVTKVEGDTIHTIEGNIDGGVAKRKERDTSKVVGYGYPDRVKERLDAAAAKKARKQAGQDGTIQLGEESLASMIPRGDTGRSAQVPLDAGRIQSQDPSRAQTPSTGQVEGQTPAEAQGRAGDQTSTQTGRSDSAQTGRSDSTLTGRSGATSDAAPQQQAATAPRAGSTSAPRPAATQQSPQTGASPAPGTVKKGKHAKPATADTEAATAEPLPAHGDASATGPLPAINSPTLIGSALVAALALLAVAKTRRLRLSTAGATAGKPARPSRAKGRRRRRGPAPVTATAKTAVELQESADRLATAAALRSLTAASAASDVPTSATAASEVLTSATASDALTSATASNLRHGVRAGGARHRKLPFETRPFDLSTDAPRHHTHERPTHEHHPHERPAHEHHGSEHHAGGRHTGGHHEPRRHTPGHRRRPASESAFTSETPFASGAAFTPAFDSEPYEPDLDLSRFAFTEHTGPLERITFTDETGPVEVVLDTGPLRRVVDTGPFERIVIPGASSAFDAFSPPRRRGGGDGTTAPDPRAYRGRRRRAAIAAAEEHAGFSPDLPLRGRRHRRTRTDDERHLVGGGRHRA